MASVNIDEVVASFGNYYRDEGQGMKDLDMQLLLPSTTDRVFGVIPTKNTTERRVRVNILGQVYQKFQAVVSASGSFKFVPRTIQMQDFKYEISLEDLDALEESYLAFLFGFDGNDRSKIPFIQYIVNQMVVAKGESDWEDYESYLGVFTNITTPGTANAPGYNYKGFKVDLRNFADEGSSNIIPLGTLETDPLYFYQQINDWVQSGKTDKYNSHLIEKVYNRLCMAPDLVERYADGKDIAMNTNYRRAEDTNLVNPVTEVQVKRSRIMATGLDGMRGTEDVFMTAQENCAGYIRRPRGSQEFGINMANPYAPVLYLKGWKGHGVWHPELLHTNVTNS